MDIITIGLIVLIVLALSGAGTGYYYQPAAPAGGTSPLVGGLGVLALILIVALVVLLATGWRFGIEGLTVYPPR